MLKTRKNGLPEKKGEQGFTLIELSIVLVIIGLIVGGILTGQDLIKAAEQRATLAQIEKYNTAVNTFRNKFGGIPGDLPWATANSFNLQPAAGALTAGGDGNGILQDGQATNGSSPVGEILLFWQQLGSAGLIDGSYGAAITVAGVGAGVTAADFPLAKLGRGNYIISGSSNADGFNYFGIAGVTAAYTGGAAGTATFAAGTNNLSPIEAYSMDKKVDDGLPVTGSVQARSQAADTKAVSILESFTGTGSYTTAQPTWNATPTTTAACTTTGASGHDVTDTYAISTGGVSPGTTPGCSLRFRFN